ncbi:hypothetical protein CHCC14814_1284 [Bacillus paralicheniformis]|nr:hypothetical protein CHCC14814_1284 [Bacillus paralicheniformis]
MTRTLKIYRLDKKTEALIRQFKGDRQIFASFKITLRRFS